MRRQGLGVLVSVAIFGIAIAAFGLVPGNAFLLGCALLAIAQGCARAKYRLVAGALTATE